MPAFIDKNMRNEILLPYLLISILKILLHDISSPYKRIFNVATCHGMSSMDFHPHMVPPKWHEGLSCKYNIVLRYSHPERCFSA